MIGISACLGGISCRYDGEHQAVSALVKLVEEEKAVMVCPEVLGGLPIPRDSAEIVGGDGRTVWQKKARVITSSGQDVSKEFMQGAVTAFEKLTQLDIKTLILKEKSPSCGSGLIYDGSFSGLKKEGVGVATAYFQAHGLRVLSDEQWLKLQEESEWK